MKSVGARMDFARNNNQYFATKLKDEELDCRRNAASKMAKPPRNLHTTPATTKSSRSPSPSTVRSSTSPAAAVPQYACICNRKSQVFECKICKMYIYGRVSEVCPAHPNVTYLLDLFNCPSCLRTKDSLEVLSN